MLPVLTWHDSEGKDGSFQGLGVQGLSTLMNWFTLQERQYDTGIVGSRDCNILSRV